MTVLADLKKWEPWINMLKNSKITQLAMQKWMNVKSSARELNVLMGADKDEGLIMVITWDNVDYITGVLNHRHVV